MESLSSRELRDLIKRTQARFAEIDHADYDKSSGGYRTASTAKWEQAAREVAPWGWAEYVRILSQGWDYCGGSRL
jgi:hypothetical protein